MMYEYLYRVEHQNEKCAILYSHATETLLPAMDDNVVCTTTSFDMSSSLTTNVYNI
uniref:Uncharacterized protein n=1 Tax=Arion vulgaris TaxID=1028688 RepID=A0A0B6YRM1_9EUPU